MDTVRKVNPHETLKPYGDMVERTYHVPAGAEGTDTLICVWRLVFRGTPKWSLLRITGGHEETRDESIEPMGRCGFEALIMYFRLWPIRYKLSPELLETQPPSRLVRMRWKFIKGGLDEQNRPIPPGEFNPLPASLVC